MGRHVFCEKPMALNVVECEEMIRHAEANGVKLLIGHVMRQLPLVKEVRRMILSGRLGEPVAMVNVRYQPLQRKGWWSRRELVGGLLHSPSIHNLDLMNWFLGRAVAVYGEAAPQQQKTLDYPDTIMMQARYGSGAVGTLAASISDRSYPPAGTNWGQITCTRGAVTLDLVGDGKVIYYGDNEPPTCITSRGQSPSSSESGADYALNAELVNFAEWILGTAEPFINPSEAAAAVELCEAAYLSIEQSASISLPLDRSNAAFCERSW
jgi:predicted dehydrogenase